MCSFTGTLRLHIIEAIDLRPTEYSTRLANVVVPKTLDPYVSIGCDDLHLDRTTSKQKCNCPVWNEEFTAQVQDALSVCLTVFHNAAIPPDDFIANCSITFDDILATPCQDGVRDFWVCSERQFNDNESIFNCYFFYF